jgi:hypothetical protein
MPLFLYGREFPEELARHRLTPMRFSSSGGSLSIKACQHNSGASQKPEHAAMDQKIVPSTRPVAEVRNGYTSLGCDFGTPCSTPILPLLH